jgi:hypothetical protein
VRKKSVFKFLVIDVPVSSLPLQTSEVEGSRSSGKSRGDEAIQSAGKKENALPKLDSKKSA